MSVGQRGHPNAIPPLFASAKGGRGAKRTQGVHTPKTTPSFLPSTNPRNPRFRQLTLDNYYICSNITSKRRSETSDQRTENEESPRRNGERAPPLSAPTNTIEYCIGRGRVARSRRHTAPRRCPPKVMEDVWEDGRNATAKSGYGGRCSSRVRMRSVTLAPTRKPDGKPFLPFAKRKGTRRAKPRRRGCPFKVRANASLIRQTSARLVGRVRLRHQRGEEPSDGGGRSSRRPRRADGLATSAMPDQVVQLLIARDPKETARR